MGHPILAKGQECSCSGDFRDLLYQGSSNFTLRPNRAATSLEFLRWNCNDRMTEDASRSASGVSADQTVG
jgi:hypothetical protein